MSTTPRFVVGSREPLKVQVTSDVPLTDADAVEIKLGGTWRAATWLGTAATTRFARVMVDFTGISVGNHQIYVRVTDSDEAPLIDAGRITVEAEKAS